jgi:hypothetical protein
VRAKPSPHPAFRAVFGVRCDSEPRLWQTTGSSVIFFESIPIFTKDSLGVSIPVGDRRHLRSDLHLDRDRNIPIRESEKVLVCLARSIPEHDLVQDGQSLCV